MTEIVAIVADCHINSTIGLCGSTAALDDGGSYTPSKAQRWLHKNFVDFAGKVKHTAEQHPGATITTILNGDIVEGDSKKRSNQIITRNRANIVSMAQDTLAPLIDISGRVFVIRGTPAHVGKSAELEEQLANDITITEKATDTVSSWWTFCGEFGGVLFDVAHHGRVGSLPWNRSNPLGQLAVRLMLDYAGRKLPQVAVRSHNHKYASTHDNYPVMVVTTPAWQLANEYSNRLGIVEPADIGGLIFVCDKGQYTWEKILYKPEAARPWKSPNKTSSRK